VRPPHKDKGITIVRSEYYANRTGYPYLHSTSDEKRTLVTLVLLISESLSPSSFELDVRSRPTTDIPETGIRDCMFTFRNKSNFLYPNNCVAIKDKFEFEFCPEKHICSIM
jgi:hypothetical protein